MYSLVIGVLAAIALGIFVLAEKMSEATQGVYTRESSEYRTSLEERIKPVGQVTMPGDELRASAAVVETLDDAAPVAAAMSGSDVYNSACVACHGPGVAGAPMLGNQEQWAPRIAQGLDVLKGHAINGFSGALGYMPAKGGRMDLSDDEVGAAVEYMVDETS
jgi:cytochrome c5